MTTDTREENEMLKYPKIQTAYLRDPDNKHKTVLEGQWARPEFDLLQNIAWEATEKIHGTGIRLSPPVDLGGELGYGSPTVRGRTDKANTPDFLRLAIEAMFETTNWLDHFDAHADLTLYGEGYGAKTQKGGGNYIADGCSFILFDVWFVTQANVPGVWLHRESVDEIAGKLGIKSVPVIDTGSLLDMLDLSKHFDISEVAENREMRPEGLVIRPFIELLDHCGHRIITKIKHKDWGITNE